MKNNTNPATNQTVDAENTMTAELPGTEEIISDYRIAYRSRQASLLGRREVLTGKAKFGIFGDGKEVPQLAMARAFRDGDIRSGYYRDQTFMFAAGMLTIREFFAQLYAHADVGADPSSAGRSMNGHFATRSLNADGTWRDMTAMPNSSSDVSPTGSQMPRLVGLGYASRLYRELEELREHATGFSSDGREVAFGTIGNASCAEGMFWEAINAIGVLRAPVVMSIWDDGYGISVPNEFQITKGNLSSVLEGFKRESEADGGFEIHAVRGWDYPALVEVYQRAAELARRAHVPAILHITEITQPQGHSTSGSHERYKSPERLEWEREHDGITRMRGWMIGEGIATEEQLESWEREDEEFVRSEQQAAWRAYHEPILEELREVGGIIASMAATSGNAAELERIRTELESTVDPYRKDVFIAINRALVAARGDAAETRRPLVDWKLRAIELNEDRYGSHLYCETARAALNVEETPVEYAPDAPRVQGFQVLNACFDAMLERDPRVIAFGEDVGLLGGVNQGMAGLQEKYGPLRVSDTGIRETTIVGQAIGMAMRGLRPIAEIQYLDYLLYALQIIADDLATVQYRTKGGQMAPVVIRTRGHRLEGIWHTGSPMAGIINLVRGIYVAVPRDMTQAAGFYNTLMRSDEPGLVIETLNAYRLREPMPSNIGEFTIPLGVPEVVRQGRDITLVTYGASVRIAMAAAEQLTGVGIDVEVIDARTLLPFDRAGVVGESLAKTSRLLVVDEDVPGGASACIVRQVLEEQDGYRLLDSAPCTLTAGAHRTPYGTDGDYFSKPNAEGVFQAAYGMMNEFNPNRFPTFLS